jgi:hypothetical protein
MEHVSATALQQHRRRLAVGNPGTSYTKPSIRVESTCSERPQEGESRYYHSLSIDKMVDAADQAKRSLLSNLRESAKSVDKTRCCGVSFCLRPSLLNPRTKNGGHCVPLTTYIYVGETGFQAGTKVQEGGKTNMTTTQETIRRRTAAVGGRYGLQNSALPPKTAFLPPPMRISDCYPTAAKPAAAAKAHTHLIPTLGSSSDPAATRHDGSPLHPFSRCRCTPSLCHFVTLSPPHPLTPSPFHPPSPPWLFSKIYTPRVASMVLARHGPPPSCGPITVTPGGACSVYISSRLLRE